MICLFCSNCGEKIEKGVNFCSACGKEVNNNLKEGTGNKVSSEEKKGRFDTNNSWHWVLVALAFGIVGRICLFIGLPLSFSGESVALISGFGMIYIGRIFKFLSWFLLICGVIRGLRDLRKEEKEKRNRIKKK